VTAQDERYGDLDKLAIFGGSVYPEMASDICRLLGIEPGKVRTHVKKNKNINKYNARQ
jgi:phosphoribosylpyrophosphate synthetase